MKTALENFTPAPGIILVKKILIPQRKTYKNSDLMISNRANFPQTFIQMLKEWDEYPFVGQVVKIGPGVKANNGTMIDVSWIKEGDVIFSKKDISAQSGVLLGGEAYFWLYANEVFGKAEKYKVNPEEFFNEKV